MAMLLGVVAGSPATAEAKKLSGEEIKTAFAGSRLYIELKGRFTLRTTAPILQMDFKPGGILEGIATIDQHVIQKDIGQWRVAGDTLCRKWSRWGNGKEECFGIELDGDRAFWHRPDGTVERTQLAR